jgi:DNA-binding IscR family transcriptional regulator
MSLHSLGGNPAFNSLPIPEHRAFQFVVFPTLHRVRWLVRQGILRGTRGPRGGYELARDRRRITANDILRAARTISQEDEPAVTEFPLLKEVVAPALAEAESAFSDALARIGVEDLALSATTLHKPQD